MKSLLRTLVHLLCALMLSSVANAANTLRIEEGIGRNGSAALRLNFDSDASVFLEDKSPVQETHYSVQFWIRIEGATFDEGSELTLLAGLDGLDETRFTLAIRNVLGQLVPIGYADSDAGSVSTAIDDFTGLDSQWHLLRIEWTAAFSGLTNDGTISVSLDNLTFVTVTGIANSGQTIEWIRLGATDAVNGVTGYVDIDDFESSRSVVRQDSDGDGVPYDDDNCPAVSNAGQADLDGDGQGNACDQDDDDDAVLDTDDAFPLNAAESSDTDGDGVGDNTDTFPNDPTEASDHDGDGIGDNADDDDDNDGVPDISDGYPLGFVDVPSGYWSFSFIEKLASGGVTSGCGNNNFCPEDPVNRAQMAVFLERGMRGSGFSPPAATGNVFLDIAANDFAASFIEQLFQDGITAGCGNNNYCPNAEVTRDQMAVLLLRAKYGAGYSPPPAIGVFGDVPLSHWAVHWIEQLANDGITAGCGDGNYCPGATVTRDQMAVFMVRTFGL